MTTQPLASLNEPQACDHDAHKVPVHQWDSIRVFVDAASKPDGLHVIGTGTGTHLDLFTSGEPFRPTSDPVLVVFNGAVTKRDERRPPFLSGRGIAQDTGWPFVAISDPSLAHSENLSIAWYAGSQATDTQRDMYRILRPLAGAQQNLWLVGGSAGGFAALTLGHMLGSAASVFAWNPQTDLLEYWAGHVQKYVRHSFPEIAGRMSQPDWKNHARQAFRRHNLVHSVPEAFLPGQRPRRLVYLQNHDDWHVVSHCVPYLRGFGYERVADGIHAQDDEHVVWFPEVGHGHPAPPREAVVEVLRAVTAENWTARQSVEFLDATGVFPRDAWSPQTRPRDLTEWGQRITERILITQDGRRLAVRLRDLRERFGGMSAEFETKVGGKRVHVQRYSVGLYEYTVPSTVEGAGEVLVTVRDGFGNVFRVEAFSVPPAADDEERTP